ncbi:MAG: hypothetical protein ACKVWR_11015 [Acidimicrobiales bacterium]
MAEPQVPRVRRAALPADAIIVVRGDDLDLATSRRQALTFRRRYPDWGRWGLSAFYARNDAEIDDLAADQLDRFPELSLYRVIDLEAAGFSVVPTFRTPHVTVAFDGDLDSGLAALAGTVHEQRRNPYHGPDEPEEAPE